MNKIYLAIAALFLSGAVSAQRIYWAEKVVDYSSQLSDTEYSAQQVLGKPNAMPQTGNNPTAWLPSKPNKTEHITVSFEKQVRVNQIVIAESYNPSATYQIYLYDENGIEYLVHTFNPRPIDLQNRLINIFIDRTSYKVSALKLVLDCAKVPGYNGIDAIAISPSRKAIDIKIDEPESLRKDIKIEKLDENVNSEYKETRPLISPDGKTIYFSRKNHPDNVGGEKDENDIWYSNLDPETGKWQQAQNLGTPLNTKGPNYISSITPDGNTMVVLLGNEYAKKGKMQPGVSISFKRGEQWNEPMPLEIINSYIEGLDGHYFLANNRKTLIMSVNRFDSYGGRDLYVSFLKDDGKWTEPKNLGNDVNSAGNELSPFLAPDHETLYFSSSGFSGYGGTDIYISRRLDDTWTNWTEPENLGSEINTDGDDEFFTLPPSGKFAYFTRGGIEENADIHQIELPIFYQPSPVVAVKGFIFDQSSDDPVEAKISYTLLPEQESVGFVMSDPETGEYEILLPAGSSYSYVIEAEGYAPIEEKIDLQEEVDYREIERNLTLVKEGSDDQKIDDFFSKKTDKLVLGDAVLFDVGSEKLKEEAKPLLDKVSEHLKKSAGTKLEISGHTDNVGPDEVNKTLSEKRAESVKAYLVAKGLNKSRFTTVGKGASQPITSNATEDGRARNRRVEFKVVD